MEYQSLTPEALALLERVKKAVRANAKSFSMDWWFRSGHRSYRASSIRAIAERAAVVGLSVLDCRTQACLAGFVCLEAAPLDLAEALDGVDDEDIDEAGSKVAVVAAGLLGVSVGQASALFGPTRWPHELQREYTLADNNGDHAAMAEVACRAVDLWARPDTKFFPVVPAHPGTRPDDESPPWGDDDFGPDEIPF